MSSSQNHLNTSTDSSAYTLWLTLMGLKSTLKSIDSAAVNGKIYNPVLAAIALEVLSNLVRDRKGEM